MDDAEDAHPSTGSAQRMVRSIPKGEGEEACVTAQPAWRESDRLAALAQYRILDTSPEAAFDDVARLAADICDAPIALISFVDEDRQWFKTEVGFGVRQTPREISFCAQAIVGLGLFVVPDALQDPRFRHSPLVTGEAGIRFYAGAVLRTGDGLPLGTLCVMDVEPRPDGLSERQRRTLETLASQVMAQLELRQAVAERDLNAARLRESEKNLSTIFDQTTVGMIHRGLDGRLLMVNRRFCEIVGRDPAELAAMRMYEYTHPEDRAWHAPKFEQHVKTGEPFLVEKRYVRSDGSIVWCAVNVSFVLDDGGLPASTIAVVEEITERKQAEEALRESEEHYRYTVELNPQLPWTADPEGNVLELSRRWFDLTGMPLEAGLGVGWSEALHSEDHPVVTETFAQSIRTGEPLDVKFRVRVADNGYRWFRARAHPRRDERGEIIRWYGISEDIHEHVLAEQALRESEEHYRYTVELNPQIPWTADPQGQILEVGPRWLAHTGMSREETLGSGWLSALHPDDVPATIDEWGGSLASGTPVDIEYRIRLSDNTYRWVRARAAARRDAEGNILRWYGTVEDIHERKMADTALRQAEERYRLAARATNDVIWDHDLASDQIEWNEAITTHFGYRHDQVEGGGNWWRTRIHPEDRSRVAVRFAAVIESGGSFWTDEYRFRRADESYADIYDRGFIIRDEAGRPARIIGAMLDLSERKLAEQALQNSEERLRLAIEATGIGVWDYDARTGQREWSNELKAIIGVPADAVPDFDTFLSLVHPSDQPAIVSLYHMARSGLVETSFNGSCRIRRASDGAERWLDLNSYVAHAADGSIARIVFAIGDVTDQKTAEERIHWAANHDVLTALPNRAQFQGRLQQALDRADVAQSKVGLLLVDVDHFKQVNDSLGHHAGDMLLQTLAHRLRSVVRRTDTVARLGGDEFAVILANVSCEAEVTEAVESILGRMREPFVYDGRVLDCRASIGAAIYPEHGVEADELLKHADIALYMAKAAGRGGLMTFRSEMRADMQRRASMLAQAREAIDTDRITPFYQPKIDLASGRLAGFEALLRWHHPRMGVQAPGSIAAAFDDLDLATALSERMFDRVIADMRRWLDSGIDFGHVAVNASAAEFRQDRFAESVLARLRAADIPTSCLELEVTETVFVGRGAEYVERALSELSKAGVRIALDDFGTGYASLSHLKQFPVDIIKIDQSFVRDLEQDPDDAAIVRAVINLGQSLGIEIVAEGVETPAQAAYLLEQGCDLGQGYLFSKPVAGTLVPELVGFPGLLLKQWRRADNRRR